MDAPEVELRADCARCMALCCVTLAFDRSEWFGFDKAAGVPCPHLRSTNRCSIHGSLRVRGFPGCAEYECYGAGQRASALFAGRAWHEESQLAGAMSRAFRTLRQIHELYVLLAEAGRLTLSPELAEQRARLVQALEPTASFTAESAAGFDASRCHRDVHAFLRSLRDCVSPVLRRRPVRRLPMLG